MSRFGEELAQRYGPHDVLHRSSFSTRCRLDFLRLGPFDVGIASGTNVCWRRSNGKLDDIWQDRVFIVQQKSGQSVVEHMGKAIPLKTYDLILTDSVGHCSFNMSGEGTMSCLDLPRDWLNHRTGFQESWLARRIDGSFGVGRLLSTILGSFTQFDTGFDQFDRQAILETTQALLVRALQAPDDVLRPGDGERCLAALRDWVMANLSMQSIMPADLARVSGLSRRQLYRLFEGYGMTPSAWLWRLRLDAAHKLLREQPDLRIIEVAFSVGFNDASHFSRLFKSHFGVSPRVARRQGVPIFGAATSRTQ